jgi:K+-sensing histidine kinase KdpD
MNARLLIGRRPRWQRYGAAVALIAGVVALKWLLFDLLPPLGRDAPFLLLLVPTLLAAWFGGLGPGLIAGSLGVLAVQYLFLNPQYGAPSNPSAAVNMAVHTVQTFLLVGLMATVQSSRLRAEAAVRRVEGLYSVSATLGNTRSTAEVIEVIVHEATANLGADGVAVWLAAEGGHVLRKAIGLGNRARKVESEPTAPEVPPSEWPPDAIAIESEDPIGLAARCRGLVVVEDPEELRARFPSVQQAARSATIPASLVCAPMVVHDHVVGVLLVAWARARRQSPDERDWVSAVAQDCGTAAQRARLLETERSARREAQEATHAKDEFLANVSSELDAPLTTITGWAHLLKKQEASAREPYRHGLDVIERSAQAQARLVANIVEMSRIAGRRFQLEVSPVDLAALVRSTIEELRVVAAARGIDLELGPLAAATVMADAARMSQVINHVVSHAFKSTPPGGHVRVRMENVAHRARVYVSDDGNGLSAEQRAHIFEGLRGEMDGDRGVDRLALAMPIAEHIVVEHRGRLLVDSAGRGQGTTVTIELPIAGAIAGLLAASDGRPPVARPFLQGVRVLVVDDDPDGREVLAEMLASEGAEVRSAASATAALETAAAFSPGVVVFDIGLPEEDNLTFAHKLDEGPAPRRRVPTIALVEQGAPERMRAAEDAGFARQLAKPPDPRVLIQAVAALAEAGPSDAG